MAIEVGSDGLFLATTNTPIPNVVSVALSAPCPVAIDADGSGDGGAPPIEPATSSNFTGCLGYAIQAAAVGQQAQLGNGSIVEGFTGVTQGSQVYVAADGTLTHTPQTWETSGGATITQQRGIGIGVSATAIYFYP